MVESSRPSTGGHPLPQIVRRTADGSLAVRIRDVIRVVETSLGLQHGYLDMTGGNCAAVRWDLEGAYLLITDGDVFVYSSGDAQSYCQGWAAGIYPNVDDSEPAGMGVTERSDSEALIECVEIAMKLDGEHTVA